MADNVPVTAGTGTLIATDDVGGVQYQYVKLDLGGDGVSDPVSGSIPVTISGSIPVTIASAIEITNDAGNAIPVSASALPLPTGAATEVTLADIQTQITSLAGTIYNQNAVFIDGSAGQLILGKRRDSDSTSVADGDLNTFNMDEEGRLKVSSKPASYPDITGDITAIQATIGTPVVGGTVAGDVSRASNIMAFCTGTFAGVNVTFEGSLEATGDNNWFGIQAVRTNANTIETATGALSAAPAYAWEMSVNALKRVRVRATARTSGTQSWRFVQGTYATEPIPAAQVSATQPVSGTVTATVANATVTSANLGVPSIIADVASAALTTTTTTAALTPTFGTTYVVGVPVTVVSGTTPTLDIGVEESDDTGTNWYRVYDFPRITATGSYRSPPLTLRGNRVRYVQTVTGTTPSFTRAINRLQRSDDAPMRVSFIDRSIVPNTLNSVTPTYFVEGCADFNFTIRCTAQTAAATLTAQFSNDATNWFSTAATLATIVGTVQAKIQNEQWKFARLIVTAAGTGVVIGEATIRGTGV
jgi:hypothetical protein